MSSETDTVHTFLRDSVSQLFSFLTQMTGNSMEALKITEHAAFQFASRFDDIENIELARVQLFMFGFKALKETISVDLEDRNRTELPRDHLLDQLPDFKEKEIQSATLHKVFFRMLNLLDPEFRAILLLYHAYGFSLKQLTRIYRTPETTIRFRLSQAKEQLLNALRCEPAISPH